MPFIEVQQVINLSQEQQIIKLMTEVKCKLGVSKIEGIGVFSMFDVKKGERLYCVPPTMDRVFYNVSYANLKKLWPEQRELILSRWPSILDGSMFLHPCDEVWLASWINHSSDSAKINYDQSTDSALMDIPAGTEILEDYRVMKNYKVIYPWID